MPQTPPTRSAVLAVAATLIVACLGPTEIGISGSGRKVLFIGNSHTYTNDVPGLLQALAAAAGPESLAVASLAAPDFALIDHVNGSGPRAIAGNRWSLVILQQGWTPPGPCRDTLLLAAELLNAEARKVGASVGMYQVWAPRSRPADQPGTIRSYELAADDIAGTLYPVGAAFRNALQRDPTLPLYGDDIHASPLGSYLTALVMYATVFQRTPVGLPSTVTTASGYSIDVAPVVAALLQEAAADVTVRGLGRSNGEDGPSYPNPGRC